MNTPAAISIIGGGFAGTLVAVHLLRTAAPFPLRVVLIERSGPPGRGLAYSTTSAVHWLNVPAGRMSALPDDPDHFVRWAQRRNAAVAGGDFLPRRMYGEYLSELLIAAVAERAPGVYFEHRAATAIDIDLISGELAEISLADGSGVRSDRVILALGNFPPADPPAFASLAETSRYVRNPWSTDVLERLAGHAPILLVGTGLTMIDVALELRERGHSGPLIAISRRGLLPQPHRTPARPPAFDREIAARDFPATTLGQWRTVRQIVADAAARGTDWRDALNAFRPFTAQLWGSLPAPERDRFLRHVRPYWDTHRHRTPPQAADRVEDLIASRDLRILAGNLTDYQENASGATVGVRARGTLDRSEIHVGYVINCTGPQCDYAEISDPLIGNLRRRGLIRPSAHRIGFDVDHDGRVANSAGSFSNVLFTLGAPRAAQLWESTAVPELRVQAAELARLIPRELLHRSDAAHPIPAGTC